MSWYLKVTHTKTGVASEQHDVGFAYTDEAHARRIVDEMNKLALGFHYELCGDMRPRQTYLPFMTEARAHRNPILFAQTPSKPTETKKIK